MAEVGSDRHGFFGAGNEVADGFDRVVRESKGFDGKVAPREGLATLEARPFGLVLHLFLHHAGGEAVGDDWNGPLFQKHIEAAGVVAVLMS